MDLKVSEVAELLNVSEDVIFELISKGNIPSYKIEEEYRFDPLEVENWISQKKDCITSKKIKEALKSKIGFRAFSLYRAIHKGQVIDEIESDNKEQIIKDSVEILSKDLDIDSIVLKDLLMDREKLMSTGVGEGIAIPHTRDFLISKPYDIVSVVYLKKSIDYDSLDGKKVHTLFFLFASDNKRHLNLLAKIAQFVREKRILEFIKSRPDKKELLAFIKSWEVKMHSSLK